MAKNEKGMCGGVEYILWSSVDSGLVTRLSISHTRSDSILRTDFLPSLQVQNLGQQPLPLHNEASLQFSDRTRPNQWTMVTFSGDLRR